MTSLSLALSVIVAWAGVMRGILTRAESSAVRSICPRCYRPYEREALGQPVCGCDR